MYHIVASSIPGPSRLRPETNQDYYRYEMINGLYVLVVCDGVSSSPSSAEGSRIACDAFLEYIKKNYYTNALSNFEELVCNAIQIANDQILAQHMPYKAMSTIAAAVVDPSEQQIIVGNVGDSPIYHIHDKGEEMCANLDIRLVPRMVGGETIVLDGMPVMDQGLTAALGTHISIQPHVFVKNYRRGDVLALCTDGVDKKAIITLLNDDAMNLNQDSIDEHLKTAARRLDDDSTLILLYLDQKDELRELDAELKVYLSLTDKQKRLLFSRLLKYRYFPKLLLLTCYEKEVSERNKISIFQLLSKRMSKKEKIALADEKKKNYQPNLLQVIIKLV
ncbi:MAG: SpoIIE family protein phosphatase, partial [Gammaproteobacteria bacterium]|nr:SpoIIE family protein phosphatase [Gammaproteobacteria bacterium]